MQSYKSWKLMNESILPSFNLGLGRPSNLGITSQFGFDEGMHKKKKKKMKGEDSDLVEPAEAKDKPDVDVELDSEDHKPHKSKKHKHKKHKCEKCGAMSSKHSKGKCSKCEAKSAKYSKEECSKCGEKAGKYSKGKCKACKMEEAEYDWMNRLSEEMDHDEDMDHDDDMPSHSHDDEDDDHHSHSHDDDDMPIHSHDDEDDEMSDDEDHHDHDHDEDEMSDDEEGESFSADDEDEISDDEEGESFSADDEDEMSDDEDDHDEDDHDEDEMSDDEEGDRESRDEDLPRMESRRYRKMLLEAEGGEAAGAEAAEKAGLGCMNKMKKMNKMTKMKKMLKGGQKKLDVSGPHGKPDGKITGHDFAALRAKKKGHGKKDHDKEHGHKKGHGKKDHGKKYLTKEESAWWKSVNGMLEGGNPSSKFSSGCESLFTSVDTDNLYVSLREAAHISGVDFENMDLQSLSKFMFQIKKLKVSKLHDVRNALDDAEEMLLHKKFNMEAGEFNKKMDNLHKAMDAIDDELDTRPDSDHDEYLSNPNTMMKSSKFGDSDDDHSKHYDFPFNPMRPSGFKGPKK